MQRERKFMDDKVWKTILLDYIVPYRYYNSFCPPTFIGHKDGEPLLNKQFPDRLVELALAAPDMKVDIYSHGLMLPKLYKQGRDFFRFLDDLPLQVRYMMSYHPVNHDGSGNDYKDVIMYLTDVLLTRKPSNVEFITVSHKSKWVTEKMQLEWKQTWEGLPITVHSNCSINPWTGRMEDIATCHYNGCPYSDFGHWFFGVTGNVIACCLDLEEEIVLGNVLESSPEILFERTKNFYARQREILSNKQKVDHPVCANCFGQDRSLMDIGIPWQEQHRLS